MSKGIRRSTTTGLIAAALVLPLAAPASAATVSDPMVEGLAGPLDLSVGPDGSIYIAEGFAGTLTRLHPDGETSVEVQSEDGAIAGIDARRTVQRAYVTSGGDESDFYAKLIRYDRRGEQTELADLQKHEVEQNPDGDVQYGFVGLEEECAEQVPEYAGGGEGYTGIIESNPYAVAIVPGGWVVADAAANALISVRRNGDVSTLAVLPRHSTVVTLEMIRAANEEAEAQNAELPPEEQMELLPECAAGATHHFEPVPTDVEIGRDGQLYVTTLAGGPESPAFGARSKVFEVDRRTRAVTELGSGFAGAVDIAVSPDGDIYVAELFGGISKLEDGGPMVVADVATPGALEWHEGGLLAATDIFDQETGGKVVTITLDDSGV